MAVSIRSEKYDLLGLLVLVTVVLLFLASVEGLLKRMGMTHSVQVTGDREQADVAQLRETEPGVVIDGFQFLHTPPHGSTLPLWKLEAERAVFDEDQQKALLTGITATYAAGGEHVSAILTGAQGRIDLEAMDFLVSGDNNSLSLMVEQQYELRSRDLHWDNRAERLETAGPVTITGDSFTVTGRGLQWSLESRELRLLHDVQMVMTP